jgi:hypothetical protein
MILQLDSEPLAEELRFLLIRVDVMSPVLGEANELAAIVVLRVVPLLQVEELC